MKADQERRQRRNSYGADTDIAIAPTARHAAWVHVDGLAPKAAVASATGLRSVRRQELLLGGCIQSSCLGQAMRCLKLTKCRTGPDAHHTIDLARVETGIAKGDLRLADRVLPRHCLQGRLARV
jgi:hypothetical protein